RNPISLGLAILTRYSQEKPALLGGSSSSVRNGRLSMLVTFTISGLAPSTSTSGSLSRGGRRVGPAHRRLNSPNSKASPKNFHVVSLISKSSRSHSRKH